MLLDLNVLPLYRQDGQDLNELPGLYMVTPPRRVGRGREKDRLLLYFTMLGNAPLADSQILPLLQRLAQAYYKVSGSITTALRVCATNLNLFLLDRNLRSSSTGRQGVGVLAMAVLKDERLTLAHCGPVHTFVMTPQETQDLYDPQGSKGLGLTRAISLRYFQIDLHPNDLLLFVSQPPPAWTALSLQNVQTQGAETLRRRLLSQAGPDVSAVIIQVQGGTGKLRLLRPKAPVQMATPSASSVDQTSQEQPPHEAPALAPDLAQQQKRLITDIAQEAAPAAIQTTDTSELAIETPGNEPSPAEPTIDRSLLESSLREGGFERINPAEPQPPTQAPAPSSPQKTVQVDREIPETAQRAKPTRKVPEGFSLRLRSTLSPVSQLLKKGVRRLALGLYTLLKRVLPDESLFSIPASTMVFIAIAVALIIATAGGAVYFQRGREVQYQAYYDQAILAAQQALGQTDPNELRTDWETTLDFLDRAETFKVTDQSKELRLQAQNALDQLDYIQRLDFQPILTGGLGSQVQVVSMLATDTEVYLLNGNGGSVLRLLRTGQGFELDLLFECGPTPQIGPLIDISLAPKGNDLKATLLGMDARGNLLYCIPGKMPVPNFPNLPQASEQGMRAFALDSNTLYLLDPGNNAVWYYRNMEIDQPPHIYFGPDRPDDVQGILDMAVNRDDLFLLHEDGYMIHCVFGGLKESPTRCEDPATYYDPRPGRKNGPTILDARFRQMLYLPPPDPSLYLFDPINGAIYHFGLRLTFQRQFRSLSSLPADIAPAFAIAPNRAVFLVAGNQVYSAILP